jgi:hypothetical protein
MELYRARIIKVNNTGFTCQYYKNFEITRNIENNLYTDVKVWVDELEPVKRVVRDLKRLRYDIDDDEWGMTEFNYESIFCCPSSPTDSV